MNVLFDIYVQQFKTTLAAQVAATLLPFRWTIGFPAELLLGRLTPSEALTGFAASRLAGVKPGIAENCLARRRAPIFGTWIMTYLRLLYIFFRMGVLGELAYCVNFSVQLFQPFLGLGTASAGQMIIFQSMHEAECGPVSPHPSWPLMASRLFWRSGIRYDSGAFA